MTLPRFTNVNLKLRAKASALHFLASLLAAILSAILVFGLWYRWPYTIISGGQELFILLVSVDVVLGPLLTFLIFDPKKGRSHLTRDLAVIVTVQLAALIYGLYTVYKVRPVALVFEVDRFRVIAAYDVYQPELQYGLKQYRRLPLTGPWTLGTRRVRDSHENTDALLLGFKGIDIGQRPLFWQPYELSKPDILKKARPLKVLMDRYPSRRSEIDAAIKAAGIQPESATFLPVVGRSDWIALLDRSGNVATFLPLDGFF